MKLWTTMPEKVYRETLLKTGTYTCDTNKCAMLLEDSATKQFKNAYDWLINVMEKRIGKAPDNVKYPVWAWYRLRGKESRPDLRWIEFRGFPETMVLIEFEVPDNKVVLSDEEKWTAAQLNNTAWCDTDEELDWYYDSNDSWQKKEEFKKKSWYRIFDIKDSYCVQATLWELKMSDVTRVWTYNKDGCRK